ncbi:hypothetical protein INT47_001977 [Mucor saturninus]|uniref:Signal peptidase complex subunit 2 n=1 Tax=Mucor saturninus TaxID=64648 RepID=A0A8H7VAY4_9FUNG|nr:hypothetical protein INT47_001977 [Mucor saturninus]
MSQTTATTEPVEVTNVYDATQLKNAVDDELARFYSKDLNFVQSHIHTDIKLLLGYVSCFIAGGAFLYEYKTSFNEALQTTTMCVIAYWIIQMVAFTYSYVYEKDEIFAGTQKVDGKVTGSLKISGKLDKFSSVYELKFTYKDKSSGKSVTNHVQPNVAKWFTTKGTLVSEIIDKDLSMYLTTLQNKLHQQ